MDKHVPDFASHTQGGLTHSKFRLATSVLLADLVASKTWKNFCKREKCGIYEWSVQGAANIADAGWLSCSIQAMQAHVLAPAIQSQLPLEIKIVFKWKAVCQKERVLWKQQAIV